MTFVNVAVLGCTFLLIWVWLSRACSIRYLVSWMIETGFVAKVGGYWGGFRFIGGPFLMNCRVSLFALYGKLGFRDSWLGLD